MKAVFMDMGSWFLTFQTGILYLFSKIEAGRGLFMRLMEIK